MSAFPEYGRAATDDTVLAEPLGAPAEHAPFAVAADDLEPPPTTRAPLRFVRWAVLGLLAIAVVALGTGPLTRLLTEEEVEDVEPAQEVVSLEAPVPTTQEAAGANKSAAAAPLLDGQFPATVSARYPEAVDPAKLTSPLTIRTAEAAGKNYVVILERDYRNVPFVVLYMSPGQSVDLGIEPGRYRVTVGAGERWLGDKDGFGYTYVRRDLLIAQPHVKQSLLIHPTFERDSAR